MRFDTKYLPFWLQNMQQMNELLTVESKELDRLHNVLEEYIKELSLNTANELLSRYEKIFDLTGEGLTQDERRKNLIAKLNARYTATRQSIYNELTAMTGLPVEIEEHPEQYLFLVNIVQSNLSDAFVAAIRDYLDMIKPAHIAYDLTLVRYEQSSIKAKYAVLQSSILDFKEVV
ncbi:YmfQ family protein [[Clostridium] innocuum]|nr:YmfQ family protein [[Clostridium] innocuum]